MILNKHNHTLYIYIKLSKVTHHSQYTAEFISCNKNLF